MAARQAPLYKHFVLSARPRKPSRPSSVMLATAHRPGDAAYFLLAQGHNGCVDFAAELQKIYDSEINVRISWLWDGGIDVRLGDDMNGYLGRRECSVHERNPSLAPGGDCAFLPALQEITRGRCERGKTAIERYGCGRRHR